MTSANVADGRAVARFLLSCGHRTIAHFSGWSGSSTGRDRQAGFCEVLESADITPQVVDGMFDRDTAMAATHTLMQSATPPDAIFVGNDHMAFAVLDTLRYDLRLRVPQDVAVIGYDGVPVASRPAYNLTTMRQPLNRMVQVTVDTLLDRIADPMTPARRIEPEGPLIERGTTKGPIT